jgi:hypothetical protein
MVATDIAPDDVRVESRDGEVTVHVSTRGTWLGFRIPRFGSFRSSQVTLYVPTGLTANVNVNAGEINVEDLGASDLTLRSNVGAILVRGTQGRLEARSDVGRIEVDGFSGALDVRSNVGAVDLDLADLKPGEHHVRSDVGRVRVRLPYGAPIHVVTRTDVGRVRNDFPAVPSPSATLHVWASVGGVDIQPSGSPGDAEDRRRRRDEERMRILTMLERREISVQEAEELLQSFG